MNNDSELKKFAKLFSTKYRINEERAKITVKMEPGNFVELRPLFPLNLNEGS